MVALAEHNGEGGPQQQRSGAATTAGVVRQFKILVLALTLSNVILGVFGFLVLREIDRKYSTLVAQAVPSMNDLQGLTTAIVESMRGTSPTVFPDAMEERAGKFKAGERNLERLRDLHLRIGQRIGAALKPEKQKDFEETGAAFVTAAHHVLELMRTSDKESARRVREAELRPVFERYLAVTTNATDALETESLHKSDTLVAHTGSMSTVLLGLAGWPVVILGSFLLLAFGFATRALIKVLTSRAHAL